MMNSAQLIARWQDAIMPTYPVPTVTAVRGQGAVIWDADGKSYVDMAGGIAVNALGHANPAVVAAVNHQVATLGHVSNLVASQPAVDLAERLLGLAGQAGGVFFGNSGAEANEAAIKLARRTGRIQIIAAQGSFHGRTMGALSLTGQPAKQEPFAPLLAGVTHVPYGDAAALGNAVNTQTAMIILEPILGEGGVIAPPPGYLRVARELATAHGALLAFDEVQTGIGRTGAWFAFQHERVMPDVVTLAKGLGGGLPIGACLAFGEAARLFQPGQHASTFGGNPVCCAAALAVLTTIDQDGLLERATKLGARLRAGIEAIGDPRVSQVRGAGLLLGVVFHEEIAAKVSESLQNAGYLVNTVAPEVIRLAPPLVLTDEQADGFVAALATVSALSAALSERLSERRLS